MADKAKSNGPTLIVLGIGFLLAVGYCMRKDPSFSGDTRSNTLQLTLNDGSTLAVENVRPQSNWECGTRKTGTIRLDTGERGIVNLYFDRSNNLVSINTSGDNAVVYAADPSKECLMNWNTKQMELLSQDEYRRHEQKNR